MSLPKLGAQHLVLWTIPGSIHFHACFSEKTFFDPLIHGSVQWAQKLCAKKVVALHRPGCRVVSCQEIS
jgi:hypothetical protein